jgi:DNA-binding SARP family transcriptional activator
MDVLWPEASLKAARNNLNVALYGLRRTLRAVTDVNLVVYHAGAYQVSGEIEFWLDIDDFERHIQQGRQYEASGRREAAVREYEAAAGLYQGDFLADDLYEEWAVTPRQHLRLAYQEILDRLSQSYFGQEQFAACISMCQILLSYDNCREDVHCRLMRCYSRQGLDHLALRQFQICKDALRKELEVTPSAPTTQLFEQIRRHERV